MTGDLAGNCGCKWRSAGGATVRSTALHPYTSSTDISAARQYPHIDTLYLLLVRRQP